MTQPHNELITEIEEAMKRERFEKAMSEYGPYILAGCVLAILVTAFSAGYQHWSQKTNAHNTAAIIKATEQENRAQAFADAAPRLGSPQQVIARLGAAGLYLQDGNKDDARKQFEAATAVNRGSEYLRDFALLQAVRLEWDQMTEKSADKAKTLVDKLAPLARDEKSPWRAHARIEAAQITAHGMNDFKGARAMLAPLMKDEDLPPSLKQRVEALDHVYELKEVAGKADAATPAEKTETQG